MTLFDLSADQINALSLAIAKSLSQCYTADQLLIFASFFNSLEGNVATIANQCLYQEKLASKNETST